MEHNATEPVVSDAACADAPFAVVYQLRAREAADQARLAEALAVIERRLAGPDLCSIEATLDADGLMTLRVVRLSQDVRLDDGLLKPGVLEFYAVDDTRSTSQIVPGYAVFPDLTGAPVMIRWQPLLPPDPVAHAEAISGAFGWVVRTTLTQEARTAFAAASADHVGERIAIAVDNVVLMAPTVHEPISGGTLDISGGFPTEDAIRLAGMLNGGALPEGIALDLVSAETVDVP